MGFVTLPLYIKIWILEIVYRFFISVDSSDLVYIQTIPQQVCTLSTGAGTDYFTKAKIWHRYCTVCRVL